MYTLILNIWLERPLRRNSKRLSDQLFLSKAGVALLDDVDALVLSYRKSSMSGTIPACIYIGHFPIEESMKLNTKVTT